jgi:glutathione synthase/RimK-type ligase-like ATP-grasp enzyme
MDASRPDFWDKVAQLDLFVFRWQQADSHHQMAHALIPIIEGEMGIKCFPNMKTCWHYDDKIRQYYLLRAHGLPIVDTRVFWDRKPALEWLRSAPFPVVFKLKGGAGSSNVVLLKDAPQARRLINAMFSAGIRPERIPHPQATRWKDFTPYKEMHRWGGNVLRKLRGEDMSPFWQRHKNYVLFQMFLPGNDHDTRVTVIGDRAFAFRRFNRDNDFRSSGSGRISYETGAIDLKFVEKAFEVSGSLSFQSMAYDFLYAQDGGRYFCEMSYDYLDTAVFNCPGYWDSRLNWHEGHYWPQYCHLADALRPAELSQPEMAGMP